MIAITVAAGACSGVQQARARDDAAKAAGCSIARDAYREGRKALFNKGACDAAPNDDPDQCVPYVIIRETHFAHLKRMECPPEEKK